MPSLQKRLASCCFRLLVSSIFAIWKRMSDPATQAKAASQGKPLHSYEPACAKARGVSLSSTLHQVGWRETKFRRNVRHVCRRLANEHLIHISTSESNKLRMSSFRVSFSVKWFTADNTLLPWSSHGSKVLHQELPAFSLEERSASTFFRHVSQGTHLNWNWECSLVS